MLARVRLQSRKTGELNRFLSLFYNTNMELDKKQKWEKFYENPIEITELIGIYVDNSEKFDVKLWISLDKDIFIKISDKNADEIIRYLYERYPY